MIPLPGKGLVYRGMLKAAVVKLLVPLFMLEAAVFIALMGPWIIADMIVVLLALLLYAVICFLTFPKALPFSEKYEATQRKEFTGSAFVQLFILAGLAGVHYVFTLIPAGIYIYMVILVAANGWIWHRVFRRDLPQDGNFSNPPRRRLRPNMDNFFAGVQKKGPSSSIYLDSPANTR
ncbi:hypothetical protein ACFTAO_44555 [Paenibacillus rhizoplanae]